MKRLFKHKAARRSTTTSLQATTSVPASGFAIVNNSQGASASIVELSIALDDILGDIEFEGEASDFAKAEIGRLSEEVSKYSNFRFTAGVKHTTWACRSEDKPLLLAAAKCSAAIYQPQRPSILEDDVFQYQSLYYTEPTRLGTVKATAFYEARPMSPIDSQRCGILIIAIRGSASKVDHMINLNNQATAVEDFIQSAKPSEGLDRPQVHSGFLIGAKALTQCIAKQLEESINNDGPKEVLFTGHSAGAAVSSLLFHHFLSSASSKCKSPQFPPKANFQVTNLRLTGSSLLSI
ncbi:MAG: hypothetical protein Q9221_005693 [Calogaya cf. arnoldii]